MSVLLFTAVFSGAKRFKLIQVVVIIMMDPILFVRSTLKVGVTANQHL